MDMHVVHHYSHADTLDIKNQNKMAAYHTPGRGVVKTSGTLNYECCSSLQLWPYLRFFNITMHMMADYLMSGRGVIKTSGIYPEVG